MRHTENNKIRDLSLITLTINGLNIPLRDFSDCIKNHYVTICYLQDTQFKDIYS